MSISSQTDQVVPDLPGTLPQEPSAALGFERLRARMQTTLLLADTVAAALAISLSLGVCGVTPAFEHSNALFSFLTLTPSWLVALFLGGLYTLRPPRSSLLWAQQVAYRTIQGVLLGISVTFVVNPELLVGRVFYALATLIAALLFWGIRLLAVRCGPSPIVRERVLIVGTGSRSVSLAEALNNGRNPNRAQLLGAVRSGQDDGNPEDLPCPVLGALDDCEEIIRREAINHLVITPALPLSRELTFFAAHAGGAGIRVQTMESAYEELTWRAPIFHAGEVWAAGLESRSASKYATRLKRLADLALAIALMPLTLLIIGVCAVLIKLFSPGPVFYHQERIGKDGVPFTFTKLRTMVVDAEAKTGPVWAAANDPRITPIGRLMRKMRLDELPQMFSVLKGDMSLIGPRPERAHFVNQFKEQIPLYEKRLMVPPGITGWAQIHHNYDQCTDDVIEKLRYDLYYIRNLSLSLDVEIVFKTVGVMLGKKGAH